MNYEEAKKAVRQEFKKNMRKIEFAYEIYKRIESNLPDNWVCDIETICFDLTIRKGNWWNSKDGENDANEFKLVCKIVEMACPGIELKKSARATDENKIQYLNAGGWYSEKNAPRIQIEITLFYPKLMPNCKITWKEEVIKKAIVSDECLGIS